MRKINDLVSGKPSNQEGFWAMTNKIGHTLNASACFRFQAHQNMQSLLGFDSEASGVGHSLGASACQPITGSSNMCQMSLHELLRLRGWS
jgi:hypothetical protein